LDFKGGKKEGGGYDGKPLTLYVVSEATGIDPKTIRKGLLELDDK